MLIEVIASCLLSGSVPTWVVPPKWEVRSIVTLTNTPIDCWPRTDSQTVCNGEPIGGLFRVTMRRVLAENEELAGSAACVYTMKAVKE